MERLFDDANRQISEMIACNILIIEDEPLIALDIEDTITSLGHRSVGIARTHEEAVRIAREKQPQLVLSDIQLADGSSGIDAVNDILGSFDVPVIIHHRIPRAAPHRRAAGAGLRHHQAILARNGEGADRAGAFFDLRSKKAA